MTDYNKEIFKRLKNPTELYEYLDANTDIIIQILKGNNKMVFRAIHVIYSDNVENAIKIIVKLPYEDYSFLSLKIKACSQSDIHLSIAVETMKLIEDKYPKMIKKRVYIPILEAFIKTNPTKAFNFLIKISKMFRLNFENISVFMNAMYSKNKNPFCEDSSHFNDIIYEIISANELIINRSFLRSQFDITESVVKMDHKTCPKCSGTLQIINISATELDVIKGNFKSQYLKKKKDAKAIQKMEKSCLGKGHDVFIDAGNIMFYGKKAVDTNSFVLLKKMFDDAISKGHNPLVVMHRRHRDYVKKNFPKNHKKISGILKKMNIFYTPNKINDDYFFIWLALNTKNSYIITNDKLTDHIFRISEDDIHSNTLLRWIKNCVVTYSVDSGTIEYVYPPDVSYRAQKTEYWHIPIGNNDWLCLSN